MEVAAQPLRPRVTGWAAHALARLIRLPGLGRRASAVALSVTTRILAANAIAALFVAAYLTITEDVPPDGSWGETIATNATFYAGAVLVFGVASVIRGKHVFAPSWRRLDSDERPSDRQVRTLLAQPVQMGLATSAGCRRA